MTADDVPAGAWLAKAPVILAKTLEQNKLTADSLTRDGDTLGELFVAASVRFFPGMETVDRQDSKLRVILNTCEDPKGTAAIWLRAALPGAQPILSRTEQLNLLSHALSIKLDRLEPVAKIKWASLALMGGESLCRNSTFALGQQDAASRLLAAAWKATPESLTHDGKLMMPNSDHRLENKNPWRKIHHHIIEIMRNFDERNPTPSNVLPLQLWMIDALSALSIDHRRKARENLGLAPHFGNQAFRLALDNGTPWPNDPRIGVALDWLDTHNHLVADVVRPLVNQSLLNENTATSSLTARKARL